MKKIFEAVLSMEKARGIPQFIFFSSIRRLPALKVRKELQKFVKFHKSVTEIDFILFSPGGSADQAYSIIRTLRENFETVNIIVPYWAKSAATLLALGGSTIIMDEFGEFGPLDVQLVRDDEIPGSEPESGLIDEYSLTTIENRATDLYQKMLFKLLLEPSSHEIPDIRIKKTVLSEQLFKFIHNLYKPLYEKIDPYQIGEKARSLAIGERYAERILNEYNSNNLVEDLVRFVDFLVHECPDHGYIIDYSIMKLWLKNVKRSKDISSKYQLALSQLTELLYVLITVREKIEYIGFYGQEQVSASKRSRSVVKGKPKKSDKSLKKATKK